MARTIALVLTLLTLAELQAQPLLPWRYQIDQRLKQQDQLIAQLIGQQKTPPAAPQQPPWVLPFPGEPKQPLPVPGEPKQPLPPGGEPRQPLPPGGPPKQDLPVPGPPLQPMPYTSFRRALGPVIE